MATTIPARPPTLKSRSMLPTITLISNQERIVCRDPVYHARIGSDTEADFRTSCIVAWPGSAFEFREICYVQLRAGTRPTVVMSQRDGSIRIFGAYVDSIARELNLAFGQPSEAVGARGEAWMRARAGGL